jgi:hypothetical protein
MCNILLQNVLYAGLHKKYKIWLGLKVHYSHIYNVVFFV